MTYCGSRKARLSDVSRETDNDYSSFVSGISGRSVQEIDHLIEGLQGLREKLNNDGDRLHRQIAQYAAFSQSIIELTKIVSDGMASVNKSPKRSRNFRTLGQLSLCEAKRKVPTRCRDFKVLPSTEEEEIPELHQHSES